MSNSGMPTHTNPGDEGFPADLLVDLRPGRGRGVRERLAHALRAAIQEERLPGATALPPTRVLAAELGISRSVVVAVYEHLTADGYLETRQGAWTRVRAPAPPAREPSEPSDRDAVRWLNLERSSPVRHPIRLFGGLPDPALFPRALWGRHYRAALIDVPYDHLTYPDALGADSLRAALTAYLGRVRGVATAPERILVCAGILQGLTLVCRALWRAGARRIAVEEPGHSMLRTAITSTGLEPVPVPVDSDGLDPASLPDDVAAAVVTPAHSYPTGATLDAARRRALVAWARRRDAIVIEDDYNAEFRYDRAPIGALQGLGGDRVVHIGSASKTLTPALRIGWIAAPADLVDALAREKQCDDMGSPLLEQLAFARFLDGGDYARHLRRVRPIYRERRNAAIAALDELLPSARWQGAAAGLHLHLTLPEHIDERQLVVEAFDRGVLLEEGGRHWQRPDPPPSLVLGYGRSSPPTLRRGIKVLADALGQLGPAAPGRRP